MIHFAFYLQTITMSTMKLTYSQKRYIQKHYPKESVELIAKHKKIPIELIQEHIKDKIQFIDEEVTTQNNIFPLNFKQHIPYLVLLLLFILLSYANSFGADFASDDVYAILRNEKELQSKFYIFSNALMLPRNIEYQLSYVFFGLTPFFYRIWNILFHIGFVLVTYLTVPYFSKKKYMPFFVASFAAVHPMLIESVTWISGGIYAQAGFSFFVTFYLYLLYKIQKKKKLLIFSFIAFVFTLSSSEKTIILPFVIILFEFVYGSIKKNWINITIYFSIAFFWGLMLLNRISERLEYLAVSQGSTPKLLIENPFFLIPSALGTYLKLFVWPRHLTLYHSEFRLSPFQFSELLLITFLFFGIIIWSYKKNKSVFFWLSFFIITLLPTLNPFGLSWLVAERYSYLGSIGLFFTSAVLLYKLIESKKYKTFGYIIFTILLLGFSVRTIIRNIDWQNEDNLWVATAKASPSDPKTFNNLGDMYARQGNLQKAAESFSHAIELNPSYPDAHHNLANILRQAGQVEQAEQLYLRAIELNPGLWQSHQNIAAMKFEAGLYEDSITYTLKAIEISPYDSNLYLNLGVAYLQANQADSAQTAFEKAVQIDPMNQAAKDALTSLQKK